jgi:cardiolipin synthase
MTQNADWQWLRNGQEGFPAMLAAIEAARESVRLETYIYSADPLGERFREALVRARQRGARVQVLVDAFGSIGLPGAFWEPLLAAGGECRQFNPLALKRLGIRDHRKLLVCDEQMAFVGGFNIASEYDGDGIGRGWFDLGLQVEGPLAAQLALSFDEMFARADFRHKRFMRLRKFSARKAVSTANERLLLSGPGRGASPIQRALRTDLSHGRSAQIVTAYFLPSWRLRRQLGRVVRGGGRVELILAGKSDVRLSQLAGQSLYRRFLRAGVEIYEYQPQILHAKLIVIDDVVYVGSANLDPRSLNINYELMVRFESRQMAGQARSLFTHTLKHSRQITPAEWRACRTFWGRFKRHVAYLLLVRIDAYLARRQARQLTE